MHHRSAPPLSHRAAAYLVRLALAVLLWPSPSRADEPMPESVMVDRLADGDLDAFDTVGPLRRGETRGRYRGLSLSLGAHAALGPERTEHGVFVVVGIPLDAALPAPHNGQTLAHDDDSGGSLNPHLVFTAPMAGQYVLRLTTYGSRMQTGSYTVRTSPGGIFSSSACFSRNASSPTTGSNSTGAEPPSVGSASLSTGAGGAS